MSTAKKIALSGVFSGLGFALMWVFAIVPSLEIAAPALASFLVLPVSFETSKSWGFGVYGVVAVLSVLLLPAKSAALFYLGFFGYYPIVKLILDLNVPRPVAFLGGLLLFNGSMILAWLISERFLGLTEADFGDFGKYTELVLLALGNFCFLLYDRVILRNFILMYQTRWRKQVSHWL